MKKKIIILILTIFIILSGLSGFLIYYFVFKGYLPECTSTPFTSYPVEMEKISNIVPLGNLNPPGHTFPTDHIYFFTDTNKYPGGFNVYAPGDIIIEGISKVKCDPPQDSISEDYSIDFAVCKYVWGRFGHVNNLSSYITNIIGEFGEIYGDTVYSWQVAGRNYTSYYKHVNIQVQAGTLLGIAGKGGGFDFWLKDDRVQLSWVNQEWTQEFQHTVCPLNYFVGDLKENMFAMLKSWDNKSVFPANYCGKIDFDVADTAQGIWTREDYINRAEDYGLSLVYHNFNASMGAISIGYAGNSSWDSNVYTFTPMEDGFRNRKFDEVTYDGNVYYYFCREFRIGTTYTKVILIKMTGNRSLRLQFIDNNGNPLPSDPRSLWNEALSILYVR